jgi:hypothetical protein
VIERSIKLSSRVKPASHIDQSAIWATMLAPDDRELQNALLSVDAAEWLDRHSSYSVRDPRSLTALLRRAPSEQELARDVRVRIQSGRLAGFALLDCFVMETMRSATDNPRSERFGTSKAFAARLLAEKPKVVEKIWGQYKAVAHLWGACWVYGEPSMTIKDAGALARFLALAAVLQNFATTWIPPSQSAPLVDVDGIWRLPPPPDHERIAAAKDLGRWVIEFGDHLARSQSIPTPEGNRS